MKPTCDCILELGGTKVLSTNSKGSGILNPPHGNKGHRFLRGNYCKSRQIMTRLSAGITRYLLHYTAHTDRSRSPQCIQSEATNLSRKVKTTMMMRDKQQYVDDKRLENLSLSLSLSHITHTHMLVLLNEEPENKISAKKKYFLENDVESFFSYNFYTRTKFEQKLRKVHWKECLPKIFGWVLIFCLSSAFFSLE